MTGISCDKCHKNFSSNYNLKRHQIICVGGTKTNKKNSFKCEYCGNIFSRKDSLDAHINKKRCKEYEKIRIKINGNKNKTNINPIDNSTNVKIVNSPVIKNSPINVNLIVFGKDGIDSLTSKELFEMLRSDNNFYESLISMVNFNPDKPQHHNVYYSDMKAAYGKVYENKKWVDKKINEIINTLLDSKTEDLNEIIDEYGDCLSENSRKKIKETIENTDYSKPDRRKKLISYLKPILYNNRDMIIKTRKIFENNNTSPSLDDIDDETLELEKISQRKIEIEKRKKLENEKISIKKELALYVLDKTNNIDHQSMRDIINETTDINVIDVINRLLMKSCCLNKELDGTIIKKQINEDALMEKFLLTDWYTTR